MLPRYRIFKQKTFEGVRKFEQRINDEVRKGWRVVSMTNSHRGTGLMVLLEREP